MEHLMIDLETLATTADAAIVSIGAVKFNEDEIDDKGFYAVISLESNMEQGRCINPATLRWWMQQSNAARAVFSEPSDSLEEVLVLFEDWVDHENYFIWSNGASFDIPVMEHAFSYCGVDIPWKFWNHRCFRTMKNLAKGKQAKAVVPAIAHNALSDAVAQAQTLQNIWRIYNGKGVKVI